TVYSAAPLDEVATHVARVGQRFGVAVCGSGSAREKSASRYRSLPRDETAQPWGEICHRRRRTAPGRAAKKAYRPYLLRRPDRRTVGRALCIGRYLSFPEQNGNFRQRDA